MTTFYTINDNKLNIIQSNAEKFYKIGRGWETNIYFYSDIKLKNKYTGIMFTQNINDEITKYYVFDGQLVLEI